MAKKSLSFSQYRSADLIIFTVIAVVFEALVTIAATKWFREEAYSISFVYVFVAMVAMRWGALMLIPSTACAITYCVAMGARWELYVIMIVGNAFCVLLLALHKLIGKQRIRDSAWWTILYVVATFVFISLGRFLVGLLLDVTGIVPPTETSDGTIVRLWEQLLRAILYDVLPAVFALIVILICRNQNGLFEDQKHYLLRTQKERDKEIRHSNIDEE